ncbi:MAG: hypothetical protein ACOYXM_11095 [Actinomycetota bacterium]
MTESKVAWAHCPGHRRVGACATGSARWRLRAVLPLVSLLMGCAAPWADSDAHDSSGLDRELAAPAQQNPSAGDPEAAVDPSRGGSAGGDTSAATGTNPSTDGGGGGSEAAPSTAGPRRLALQKDAAGDAGAQAPAYADLVSIELVDTGGALRATLTAAGPIPRELEDSQAAGIGLDLFAGAGRESDYQIFLEGAADGWFAYLESPAGLEHFVGTFELDADRFVVEVPWESLGNQRAGKLSVFADWSSALLTLAVSSEDHAPDNGRVAYG